jgi:hypothetical protein
MVVKMVVKPIAKLSEEARSSPSRTHLHPLPGLTPDPNRRHRLEEIRDNLRQIAEAQAEGWLGEVERLQISIAGAEDKLTQLHRRPQSTSGSRSLSEMITLDRRPPWDQRLALDGSITGKLNYGASSACVLFRRRRSQCHTE